MEVAEKEYTEDMQKLYIEFLLSDPELYARCQAIIDAEYFDRKFRKSVKFIQEHVNGYSVVPTPEQLKAQTGVEFTLVKDIDERHDEWFLDDFEQFCKHKALANAILNSTDLLEENQFGAVEKMIKEDVCPGAVSTNRGVWKSVAGEPDPCGIIWPIVFR